MSERRVVEAREPFSVTLPTGVPLNVSQGDRYWSDDPVLKGREHLFTDLVIKSTAPRGPAGPVETATAAPGERRAVSTPRENKLDPEKRGK